MKWTHVSAMVLGTVVALGATVPAALAQGDPETAPIRSATASETADTAFRGFRAALVDALAETQTRLDQAATWIDNPDWYLVETPDVGVVGVEIGRLGDHAALLADPAFAARADVLDDPVHAWDDSFAMSLALIRDEGGDPIAAAERLMSSLSQTTAQKKAMLRLERRYLRADRDRLISAIDAFDSIAAGIGFEPAMLPADDIVAKPREPAPADPLGLARAFRDRLAADRDALQARIVACRAAIEEQDIIALGEPDQLAGVVVFDLTTLPDFADFPMYLRDRGEAWDDWAPWDAWNKILESDTAKLQPLWAAMIRFDLWQDWPGDMRAGAERMRLVGRPTAKEDRAVCRPLIELLRPERDRLDVALAALDEYLALVALAEPSAEPDETPEPTPKPEAEPSAPPDPFTDQ